VSGFCNTHIKDRTVFELTTQRNNDQGLTKIYGSSNPKHIAAARRLERIEAELRLRKVSATSEPVCSSYEPSDTDPGTPT